MDSPRVILTVEENPITRKMLRLALESEGYRVREAGDGESALAEAAASPPDLVVLGYALPDVNGLQLLAELRRRAAAPELPALVVTGMVSLLDDLRARGGRFTQFLPKPVEPSRLLEVVGAHFALPAALDAALGAATVNHALRREAGIHATALTVMRSLSEVLAQPQDIPKAVGDILVECLDAAGLSTGLFYLAEPGGRLRLQALSGLAVETRADAEACFGHPELLRTAIAAGAPVAFSLATPGIAEEARDLLDRLGRTAALIVPFVVLGRSFGALLLASDHQELSDAAWLGFAQSLAAQFAQTVALGQSLTRLAASEERYRALMEQANDAILLLDPAHRVIEANREAERLLGRPRAEIVGRRFDELAAHDELAARDELAANDELAADDRPPALDDRPPAHAEPAATQAQQGSPASDRPPREPLAAGRPSAGGYHFRHAAGALVPVELSSSLVRHGADSTILVIARDVTERRHADEELRDSAERVRLLLDSAAEAIYGIDLEGNCTFANPASAALLGYPGPAALLGRNMHELAHYKRPDGTPYPAAECPIDRDFRRGEAAHVNDEVLWRADGTSFPAEYWSYPMRRRGAVVGAVVTFLDTSERTRAEAGMREAQKRLQHLVSSSPAVLYSLRIDDGWGTLTWVSDNIERLTGDTAQEVMASGWRTARMHPDDRELATGRLPELLAAGSLALTYRIRHQDGSYVWIHDEKVVIRDAAGEPVEIVGSWSDVSARKRVELQLAQSEEQYRLLFDDSPQPMWVYDDATLAFLAVNDAALARYGYSREEMLALTVRDIRPPDEIEVYDEHLAKRRSEAERKGFHSSRVWRHRRKDGTLLDVEIAVNPIGFKGRPAWLAMGSDVTERRRLEALFLQAQKMESVGRLAGGVAHDFNNLLTAILGYSELLAGHLVAHPELRKHVEEIRKAGERAATLTRQLLAFSRSQVLQPKVVELNAVVVGLESLLRRLISEDIELALDLRARPGRALVDPGQVEQVLVNLVVNARDAMPDGGRLSIETADVEVDAAQVQDYPDARPGPHVMVAVADSGCGMNAEVRSHIFEPFFTTKEQGKGTGLGLATVYGIVHQSGGHVEVQSAVGRGSTFRIFFPRVAPETEAAAQPATPQAAAKGSETVLVVEDEVALRALIRAVLESGGYTVLDAVSAKAALALAREAAAGIDLLLTDVVMPGLSGPEVAARLGALHPEARVLYMSGYSGSAMGRGNLLPAGADLLEKPFTAEALLEKVREVLDEPQS